MLFLHSTSILLLLVYYYLSPIWTLLMTISYSSSQHDCKVVKAPFQLSIRMANNHWLNGLTITTSVGKDWKSNSAEVWILIILFSSFLFGRKCRYTFLLGVELILCLILQFLQSPLNLKDMKGGDINVGKSGQGALLT